MGIGDPYFLTQPQYDAVVELLRGQRELVGRYWHDVTVQIEDFTNEGFVASSSWPYQVNLLKASGEPIDSVVPAEGATGWADTTMMHAQAAHPNCAYLWMEHSLDPKVQGDVAAWFGSVPVGAGCLRSLRTAGSRRLRDQWLRELRQDLLLEDAHHQMRGRQ